MTARVQQPTGTVFVVDDEEVLRDALSWLLRSRRLLPRAFESADTFWQALDDGTVRLDSPACLMLDMRMPGMSGLEAQRRLLARQATVPVIFLTGHADVPVAIDAMKHGAFDFLLKPFSNQHLIDRIQAGLDRSRQLTLDRQRQEARDARLSLLTERERGILDGVVAGESSREIADRLNLSVRTVENHRSRIMDKLHTRSVADLIRVVLGH